MSTGWSDASNLSYVLWMKLSVAPVGHAIPAGVAHFDHVPEDGELGLVPST
jgi:hypothetical protein